MKTKSNALLKSSYCSFRSIAFFVCIVYALRRVMSTSRSNYQIAVYYSLILLQYITKAGQIFSTVHYGKYETWECFVITFEYYCLGFSNLIELRNTAKYIAIKLSKNCILTQQFGWWVCAYWELKLIGNFL